MSQPSRRVVLRAIALLPVLPGCLRHFIYDAQIAGGRILVPAAQLAQLSGPADLLSLRAAGVAGTVVLRRQGDGQLIALLAQCTHRRCEVNALPDGYECPCHGSRFDLQGHVQEGPADRALPRLSVAPTPDGCSVSMTAER